MKRRLTLKRITLTALLFLALFLLAIPAFSYDAEKYRLPNGLTVILAPDHSAPVVALDLWVKVGSFNETEKESGMSHFVEHLLFKGTDTLAPGEASSIIEASGGSVNASTSQDYTNLYAVVPSSCLKKMIQVISGMITSASFPKEEVENARKVIIEEIKMRRDTPGTEAGEWFNKRAYLNHPYGRPIAGTVEGVSGFSRDELYNYYRAHYVPSNIVLAIAGDFDTAEAKLLIKEGFGKETGVKPVEKHLFKLPMDNGLSVKGFYDEVYLGSLQLGFNIPSLENNDGYALDLLSYLLTISKTFSLIRHLVEEERLVYSVNASNNSGKEAGLFTVSSTFEADKLNIALKSIIDDVVAIKEIPIPEEELTRAKDLIRAFHRFGIEDIEGIAGMLSSNEVTRGDVHYDEKYLSYIEKVSAEEIRVAANKYLVPENLTMVYLLPGGYKGKTKADEIEGILASGFSSESTKETEGPRLVKGPAGYSTELANGIRIVIMERRDLPRIAVSVYFKGGLRYETKKNNGINNLIASMLTKGTKNLTNEAITDTMEEKAVFVSGDSGLDTFGLSAEFLVDNQDDGWKLVADTLLNPSFNSDELMKLKKDFIASIEESKESDPGYYLWRIFRKSLLGKHPYSMGSGGTKKSINLMERDDLKAYYETYAVPSNMVMAVVGDVNAEEVLKRIEDLFGDFQGPEVKDVNIEKPKAPGSPVRKQKRFIATDQAHIVVGFLGCDRLSNDSYALRVLDAVLSGQGGRLFKELREKEGLVYSVSSANYSAMDPFCFVITLETDPDNIIKSIGGITKELKKIKDGPITQEELKRAQDYIVGNYEIGRQSNSALADTMAWYETYGLEYDFYIEYPDKIYSVTSEDILRVANKYIDFNSSVTVIVKPRSKVAQFLYVSLKWVQEKGLNLLGQGKSIYLSWKNAD